MVINEPVLRLGDSVLSKHMLSTSTCFRFPWDIYKSQFSVNSAQGCTARRKCIWGGMRPACKADGREEGIQTSGRLAGAQAKPEREAGHVCPVGLDEIQRGTGKEDERIGLKDPCVQSKGEELLGNFWTKCFLPSENTKLPNIKKKQTKPRNLT